MGSNTLSPVKHVKLRLWLPPIMLVVCAHRCIPYFSCCSLATVCQENTGGVRFGHYNAVVIRRSMPGYFSIVLSSDLPQSKMETMVLLPRKCPAEDKISSISGTGILLALGGMRGFQQVSKCFSSKKKPSVANRPSDSRIFTLHQQGQCAAFLLPHVLAS